MPPARFGKAAFQFCTAAIEEQGLYVVIVLPSKSLDALHDAIGIEAARAGVYPDGQRTIFGDMPLGEGGLE